jgi:hypothetical protein
MFRIAVAIMRYLHLTRSAVFAVFALTIGVIEHEALSSPVESVPSAQNPNPHIASLVKKIRTEKVAKVRVDHAMEISSLLDSRGSLVDGNSLRAITELLHDRNDSVRFWAAAALGQMGPAASPSVPELRRALDNHRTNSRLVMSSGDAICAALTKIQGRLPQEDSARCKPQ